MKRNLKNIMYKRNGSITSVSISEYQKSVLKALARMKGMTAGGYVEKCTAIHQTETASQKLRDCLLKDLVDLLKNNGIEIGV